MKMVITKFVANFILYSSGHCHFFSYHCRWLIPIFWEGARRDLRIADLYDVLRSDESESLGDRLER